MHITTFGRSLDVLRTLFTHSQNRHGCRFRSNAYKDVCLLLWRTYRKPISEFLEHLASYNGADMHKYNTLYTHGLNRHVLTPESFGLFLFLFKKLKEIAHSRSCEEYLPAQSHREIECKLLEPYGDNL